MKTRILVWDLPTRWFHWLLVLSFAGAWLTAESERTQDLHVMFGYTLLGLIAFRLFWGVAGTRYARFAEFVRAPSLAIRYLKSLVDGRAERYIGHNPAGAMAILLLLLLGVLSGLTGWMAMNESGGDWMEEGHELFSNAMLAIVVIHVVGVIAGSLAHHENLAYSMVTGHKQGAPDKGIAGRRLIPAILLIGAVAGFWGIWLNGDNSYFTASSSGSRQEFKEPDEHRDVDRFPTRKPREDD